MANLAASAPDKANVNPSPVAWSTSAVAKVIPVAVVFSFKLAAISFPELLVNAIASFLLCSVSVNIASPVNPSVSVALIGICNSPEITFPDTVTSFNSKLAAFNNSKSNVA